MYGLAGLNANDIVERAIKALGNTPMEMPAQGHLA